MNAPSITASLFISQYFAFIVLDDPRNAFKDNTRSPFLWQPRPQSPSLFWICRLNQQEKHTGSKRYLLSFETLALAHLAMPFVRMTSGSLLPPSSNSNGIVSIVFWVSGNDCVGSILLIKAASAASSSVA
jgi:hypothetical protein